MLGDGGSWWQRRDEGRGVLGQQQHPGDAMGDAGVGRMAGKGEGRSAECLWVVESFAGMGLGMMVPTGRKEIQDGNPGLLQPHWCKS